MARKLQPQPVTAKMYRHFAVLTVAVTAAVALIADGETRQVMANEVERAQSPRPSATPTELVHANPATQSGFAGEDGFDGAFGAPMDAAGAVAQEGVLPDDFAEETGAGIPDDYTAYGVSKAAWARLSEAQRKALVARYEAEQAAARAPERADQIEALQAASRARAAAVGSD